MRNLNADNNTGIRWHFNIKLDYLEYADYKEQLQKKLPDTNRYTHSTCIK
jgi:hypothetical protein